MTFAIVNAFSQDRFQSRDRLTTIYNQDRFSMPYLINQSPELGFCFGDCGCFHEVITAFFLTDPQPEPPLSLNPLPHYLP